MGNNLRPGKRGAQPVQMCFNRSQSRRSQSWVSSFCQGWRSDSGPIRALVTGAGNPPVGKDLGGGSASAMAKRSARDCMRSLPEPRQGATAPLHSGSKRVVSTGYMGADDPKKGAPRKSCVAFGKAKRKSSGSPAPRHHRTAAETAVCVLQPPTHCLDDPIRAVALCRWLAFEIPGVKRGRAQCRRQPCRRRSSSLERTSLEAPRHSGRAHRRKPRALLSLFAPRSKFRRHSRSAARRGGSIGRSSRVPRMRDRDHCGRAVRRLHIVDRFRALSERARRNGLCRNWYDRFPRHRQPRGEALHAQQCPRRIRSGAAVPREISPNIHAPIAS